VGSELCACTYFASEQEPAVLSKMVMHQRGTWGCPSLPHMTRESWGQMATLDHCRHNFGRGRASAIMNPSSHRCSATRGSLPLVLRSETRVQTPLLPSSVAPCKCYPINLLYHGLWGLDRSRCSKTFQHRGGHARGASKVFAYDPSVTRHALLTLAERACSAGW